MEIWRLALYLTFGILPSLVWLFYYLQKDLHPEPKRMILGVFICGGLATVPLLFIQLGLMDLLTQYQNSLPGIAGSILTWFVIVAFTEELFKYLVVRLSVLRNAELDEPLDLMLYMVVAALGFAAVENTLYIFAPGQTALSFNVLIQTTITISFIRFIGATFLHTLCSALVGYFLALASVRSHKNKRLVVVGLITATFLHGLYDFSIMTLAEPLSTLLPIAVIAVLATFMLYDFNEIKKIKGICKI